MMAAGGMDDAAMNALEMLGELCRNGVRNEGSGCGSKGNSGATGGSQAFGYGSGKGEAVQLAERDGIVFIDELIKISALIATAPDVSREGGTTGYPAHY